MLQDQGGGPRLSSDWFAFDRDPGQWLDYRRSKDRTSAVAGQASGEDLDDDGGGGDGGDGKGPDFVHALDSGRRLWISHLQPDSWLLDRIRGMDALPADSAGRPKVLYGRSDQDHRRRAGCAGQGTGYSVLLSVLTLRYEQQGPGMHAKVVRAQAKSLYNLTFGDHSAETSRLYPHLRIFAARQRPRLDPSKCEPAGTNR